MNYKLSVKSSSGKSQIKDCNFNLEKFIFAATYITAADSQYNNNNESKCFMC